MKKLTTLLCSALLAAGSVSAQEQTIDFGYCDDSAFGVGYLNEAQGPTGAAIQLTDDVVNTYQGFKITHVLVCNGSTSRVLTGGVKVHINIFVTDDSKLPKNPVSLTGEDNLMNITKAGEWTEYALPEPIELKADTPLWVGYICPDADSGDSPVAVDMKNHGDAPCNYNVTLSGNGNYIWSQLAPFWGAVGIKVRLQGSGELAEKVVVGSGAMEKSTVTLNTPFKVGFTFTNTGLTTVQSIGVACSINGSDEQIVTATPEKAVAAGGNGTAYFEFSCPEQLHNAKLTCRLAEVNGNPNQATEDVTFSSTFTCIGTGYPRAMVVEEITGVWCAYCVRGMVGLEGMAEEHPDGSFVAISIHGGNDPMAKATTYNDVFAYFSKGYPNCIVNREKSIGETDPNLANLKLLYDRVTSTPSIVRINPVSAVVKDDATVEIKTDYTFAMDIPSSDIGIAYVIIEDNVGPFNQSNGYSGDKVAMGGWESKGETVLTLFNDVARYISNFKGNENSVVSDIEGGKTYSYTASVPTSSVSKLQNMRFAALVIDRTTGTILNGVKFKEGTDLSSIETVETEATDAPAVYFDLMGRRVANPAPGQLLISNGRKFLK